MAKIPKSKDRKILVSRRLSMLPQAIVYFAMFLATPVGAAGSATPESIRLSLSSSKPPLSQTSRQKKQCQIRPSCPVIVIYKLDKRYSDQEVAPGGYFYKKVDSLLDVLEPGRIHRFSANANKLVVRIPAVRTARMDQLVRSLLCETENTGIKCERIQE